MMIGILYPSPILRRLMNGGSSFEKPQFYLDAAAQYGEDIIFFSLQDIHWSKGAVIGWDGLQAARRKFALPAVIINRTRTKSTLMRQRIEQMKEMGRIIINEHNVHSKLKVHRLLAENSRLLPHLPVTDSASYQTLNEILQLNNSLYLKPITSSVGNGIIRIRRKENKLLAEMNVRGRTVRKRAMLRSIVNMVKKRRYIAQQAIPLMKYQDRPVDFRVSVQKSEAGLWTYTGMVGRAAKKGAVVTNLHCGGTSMKASELFQHWGWNGAQIEQEVAQLGIAIAETLDAKLPHLADVGIDIALDEQQHPWFIEANFRDLRITFRDAGEKEKWRATFYNPVHYAVYLSKQLQLEQSFAGF